MKNMFRKRGRHRKMIAYIVGGILLVATITFCVYFCWNRWNDGRQEERLYGVQPTVAGSALASRITSNQITGCKYISGSFYYFENGRIVHIRKDKINPKKPVIALTFDDGPGKYTKRLLKQLKKYDARATFFMVGENAQYYPEIIRYMKKIGCELGNHSYSHANLTTLKQKKMLEEVQKTNEMIEKAAGVQATLFRPPYGEVNEKMQNSISLPMIMWSLDTMDWKRKDADEITKYVLRNVKDGDIVLMHDIHKFSVDSAVELIPKLVKKGYQLVTVSELAAYREAQLRDGELYYEFKS